VDGEWIDEEKDGDRWAESTPIEIPSNFSAVVIAPMTEGCMHAWGWTLWNTPLYVKTRPSTNPEVQKHCVSTVKYIKN